MESSSLTVSEGEVKKNLSHVLTQSASRDYPNTIEVTSLKLQQHHSHQSKCTFLHLDEIQGNSQQPFSFPEKALYQIYRDLSKKRWNSKRGIFQIRDDKTREAYQTEKMMLRISNSFQTKTLCQETGIYPRVYGCLEEEHTIVKEWGGESLEKLVQEVSTPQEVWEIAKSLLYPFGLLHAATPIVVHGRQSDEKLTYESPEEMGRRFAMQVTMLLHSQGVSVHVFRRAYGPIRRIFSALASEILYEKGAKGVIHQNHDLATLTQTKLLAAGETRVGSFFCDLSLFLDPLLLKSQEPHVIKERIEKVKGGYSQIRRELNEPIERESRKTLKRSIELPQFPVRQFELAMYLIGVWGCINRAAMFYHYSEDIEKTRFQVQENLLLGSKLLEHLKQKDSPYKNRFTQLYESLSGTGIFEKYEIKNYPPSLPAITSL